MPMDCIADLISVLMEVFLFFSFGKRSAGSFRRGCECIVLEPSEMIVVRIFFTQFLSIFFFKRRMLFYGPALVTLQFTIKLEESFVLPHELYKSKISYITFLPFLAHILQWSDKGIFFILLLYLLLHFSCKAVKFGFC